jgi:uncharacterized zinc-type alcohol dehydrogenase-like protein
MIKTDGYAAPSAGAQLEPFSFDRRDVGARDVLIEIQYCGVCHSDIHQVRDEWGGSIYPMVPGHERVGRVARVGAEVSKFKEGDLAGVGCFVDSCRVCRNCKEGEEQYCENHLVSTYNGTEKDEKTPTYGGYSTRVVVDEEYVLRVPASLPLPNVAPLLCAGITTYSPLRQVGCKSGDRVGVVGLGGLGHMAVKLAASMGAKVTVLSTSQNKAADAKRLGATDFVVTKDPAALKKLAGQLDHIIDTVSAPHDYNTYLGLLRARGAMAIVGAPPGAQSLQPFSLIMGGRTLMGSLIGGIAETQEMLDHCAKHGVVSDVEVIPIQKINEAYERVLSSDVRYRFVIDLASLKASGA